MDLKDIQAPVERLLEKTNKVMKRELSSKVNLIKKITVLTPVNKGKKIRSTFLFLLARLNKTEHQHLPAIAACIEMLHLSSLIHDDVVDNSKFRRGKKTLNVNLGNYVSVLGGDFLFIHALYFLNTLEKKFLVDIVLSSVSQMIEGQILEVENNFNYNILPETYFLIVKKKTSALFAGIAQLIPTLNGDSRGLSNQFYQFGLNFGTMFQISDDILDIFSHNSGKDRFRDLKEGKMTLPYILLLRKSNGKVMKYLKNGDHEQLLDMFIKYNIRELCHREINKYYKKCVAFLTDFPDSTSRDFLINLLDFTRSRDY